MNATEQVQEYAAHVYEPDDWIELRTIKPINGRKVIRKFWRQAKDLSSLVPDLEQLNKNGFNIFIGPNPRKGKGLSRDKNVLICRCLFADFDGIEPGDGCGIWEFVEPRIDESGLPQPTFTVFSGHGIHAYWRLEEPLPPERWRSVQERLIATLDSDSACSNPERLLRLPGFLNHKKTPIAECFKLFSETC